MNGFHGYQEGFYATNRLHHRNKSRESLIKKPPCEQGGHLTIACHMNKIFDFLIYSYSGKQTINSYFFTVSATFLVVSTTTVVVSGTVVAGGIAAVSVIVESVVVVVSLLLLQATKAPAIAKIPRNFFMRILI
jgi:hypothetical protein